MKFEHALKAYRDAINIEAVASVNQSQAYERFVLLRDLHVKANDELDAARDALLKAAGAYDGTVTINDGELRVRS